MYCGKKVDHKLVKKFPTKNGSGNANANGSLFNSYDEKYPLYNAFMICISKSFPYYAEIIENIRGRNY